MEWSAPSYYVLRRCLLKACLGVLLVAASFGQSVPAQEESASASATSFPATTKSTGESNTSDRTGDGIISPDDVLDIYVLDVGELSRQYRVSPAGEVQIPLLKEPLVAGGMKASDFASQIEKRLQETGLVSNPHVTVSFVASRLKSIAITGAVKKPQIYPVFGRTTLLDALSQAEGLSEDAGSQAVVMRGEAGLEANGQQGRTQTVDLKKLLESGDPASNLDLYPGDRVTIPRAGLVYVVGAVNRPGGFPIRSSGEGITVLQAVALAEDLKSTAVRSRAMVIRADSSAPGGHRQVPMDLKKILAGKSEDPVLRAGDILFVPDSPGARALRRGVETAIGMTSAMAIYSLRF